VIQKCDGSILRESAFFFKLNTTKIDYFKALQAMDKSHQMLIS